MNGYTMHPDTTIIAMTAGVYAPPTPPDREPVIIPYVQIKSKCAPDSRDAFAYVFRDGTVSPRAPWDHHPHGVTVRDRRLAVGVRALIDSLA